MPLVASIQRLVQSTLVLIVDSLCTQDQRNLRENGIDIGDKSGYNAEDILQVAVGALGRARQVHAHVSGCCRDLTWDLVV